MYRWLIEVASLGMALFSMFFGSGNLIFPLVVGKTVSQMPLTGGLLLGLTSVILPFLGVLLIWLYAGDASRFFHRLCPLSDALPTQSWSKYLDSAFWFPLISLSLMGPFGVIPRCIMVAHSSLVDHIQLLPFAILFAIATLVLTYYKEKIIPILGQFLSPFLLLTLIYITAQILFFHPPSSSETPLSSPTPPLSTREAIHFSLLQGYQTMDLFAAFFFSSFCYNFLQEKKELSTKQRSSIFCAASILGAFLLFALYMLLVFSSAKLTHQLTSIEPQQLLFHVSKISLPSYATPVVTIAVILACLTTVLVLAELFADFINLHTPKLNLSHLQAITLTLTIAVGTCSLQFSALAQALSFLLTLLYPFLITATLLEILCYYLAIKRNPHLISWSVLLVNLFFTTGTIC